MQTVQKYIPFFLSALLMCTVVYFIYPHYQYYIDPDGTAYLTISRRYATGDYHKAINGYWSPWSCWLTALLIKTGLSAIPASVIINTTGAIGFLYISESFFIRFGLERKSQWLLCGSLSVFLCYAVFAQSFDDLWECFFLLSALRIMLSEKFTQRPGQWTAMGIIGTLAYFAKAYSFPFFILNSVCCTYFLTKGDRKLWLKISFTSVGIMLLCALPWIWLLHDKYDIWTTSTAGTLNTSWYLVGHPHWKDGIELLLPPAYPDSPSYWEDPWSANGDMPHFWNSFHLLGLQVLRIGLNIWKFIVSSLQLSIFFVVITGYAKWKLFWKRDKPAATEQRVLMLSFLLFPLGYVLVNFESRYLWYMVPLSMVLGAQLLQHSAINKRGQTAVLIVALSFIIYPMYWLVKTADTGKNEYLWAQQLKKDNVTGAFTAIVKPGTATQNAVRLAYFSGMSFYTAPEGVKSKDALLKEIERYHIPYFFAYPVASSSRTDLIPLADEPGPPPPSIIDSSRNVKVIFIGNL